MVAALAAAGVLAYALFAARPAAGRGARRNSETALVVTERATRGACPGARTAEVEEARERAERERARLETLLQDTNHRIGNSLATVSSLLGLQLARSQSEEVRNALEAAQGRVQAIASGHRRLRLGADLETTNAAEFLDAVVGDLARIGAGRATASHSISDFEPLVIPARDATTLGIVVSELVTNAIKHAFADGRAGRIWIRLDRGDDGRRAARRRG
ncbi:MAG: sensor histidine kinase [Thermomicrobiales bacterium]